MDLKELGLALLDRGLIQFGSFKLKMHEKHPDAPLSPIYVNLRRHPKGQLTPEMSFVLAWHLTRLALERAAFDCVKGRVVGIPTAAELLATDFLRAGGLDLKLQLRMQKDESGEGRKITSTLLDPFEPKQICLLLDDVITGADSKVEAVEGLRENGLIVTHCLVVIDREQGGQDGLRGHQVDLHALFKLGWLLDLYVEQGCIRTERREEVLSYRQRVEEFLAAQQGG